jgi:hypothetical protein
MASHLYINHVPDDLKAATVAAFNATVLFSFFHVAKLCGLIGWCFWRSSLPAWPV